jgi:hypothetical protein
MEHGPFMDDFPLKPPYILGIFHGYVNHNQMVSHQVHAFEPFRVLHQVLTANCAWEKTWEMWRVRWEGRTCEYGINIGL